MKHEYPTQVEKKQMLLPLSTLSTQFNVTVTSTHQKFKFRQKHFLLCLEIILFQKIFRKVSSRYVFQLATIQTSHRHLCWFCFNINVSRPTGLGTIGGQPQRNWDLLHLRCDEFRRARKTMLKFLAHNHSEYAKTPHLTESLNILHRLVAYNFQRYFPVEQYLQILWSDKRFCTASNLTRNK